MKKHGRDRLFLMIGLAVLVGLGVYWYLSGEYRDQLVYSPANSRLQTERLHLAQRWLDRHGRETEALNHLQNLDSLPARNATLIMLGALGQQSRLEARQLQQWVLRGGHLIAEAPGRVSQRERSFDLNSFRIEACRDCLVPPDDEASDESTSTGKFFDSMTNSHRRPVNLQLPDQTELAIWADNGLRLNQPSPKIDQWETSDGVAMVAGYAFGDGRITLLADGFWFHNSQLLYPDHARLLLALADQGDGPVFLQQRSIAGGLFGWLWRQSPVFWIGALILGLLWVWSRLPRLGPVMASDDNHVTQMRAHVLATARFDWRHNQARELIAALQETLTERASRRFPDWRSLGHLERVARLQRLCPDVSDEALDHQLNLQAASNADQLANHIALHHKIIHAL